MELQDYLRVVRKRWRVIAFVTLLVLALSAAFTMMSTKIYASTTQFFVSTSVGDNVAALQQGNTFTQQRVKSYSQLLESPKVLDPVIEDLGLEVTPDTLASQVSSTVPLDTVILEVTVTETSPQQAAKIAASIDKVFPKTIEEIERVQSGEGSPVKVTVVKPADVNPTPISPRPSRNLALGLVLGLLLGFGVALLREVLDTTVKSQRDVTAVTHKTVIGGIAYDGDAPDHPLIVQVDPRSQRAEAFRVVRTNLQFIDVANPPKSIVVTSSLPGEGKSTTTANLALSIAETGAKVCVIEGNLRRPRLLDYLGFEGSVGLTDVLIGRLDVEDVLQPFGRTTLSVMGAGPIPPNPSELLGSANMERLIEALSARFDYILIDAPPLLPVTDAAVLSTVVDGALVIVGAGVVAKDELKHAIDSLDAVNGQVLGLILNRVREKDGSGAYGSYRYEYVQESERQRAKERRGRSKETKKTPAHVT
ncbi:chromosome partitioning protein [Intrasporangium chromatireducens Q5-1]|uniref:non-specific protein-tyrosine kinase n=1 Tax=Intrasporangium chromatireducens Q5-1 TaxID=584657 RepID=W9GL30_9MICO|nr:polysaccharide biosynthesis tyrosine autokinase [Intrasporangium chromatireducens]EWT06971.1 chromosome partitioning protein [Intrasporangium chromatireducens Q5-1]